MAERPRTCKAASGAQLVADVTAIGARLELAGPNGTAAVAEFTEGELLMAIEALAMAYADVVGARADSVARGVNRTLRNRTQAARTRRRESESAA